MKARDFPRRCDAGRSDAGRECPGGAFKAIRRPAKGAHFAGYGQVNRYGPGAVGDVRPGDDEGANAISVMVVSPAYRAIRFVVVIGAICVVIRMLDLGNKQDGFYGVVRMVWSGSVAKTAGQGDRLKSGDHQRQGKTECCRNAM